MCTLPRNTAPFPLAADHFSHFVPTHRAVSNKDEPPQGIHSQRKSAQNANLQRLCASRADKGNLFFRFLNNSTTVDFGRVREKIPDLEIETRDSGKKLQLLQNSETSLSMPESKSLLNPTSASRPVKSRTMDPGSGVAPITVPVGLIGSMYPTVWLSDSNPAMVDVSVKNNPVEIPGCVVEIQKKRIALCVVGVIRIAAEGVAGIRQAQPDSKTMPA